MGHGRGEVLVGGWISFLCTDSCCNVETLRDTLNCLENEERSKFMELFQAMLVLLLGAACLVPHCDDEYCCQLLNNFAKSFDPSLSFVNGPPPF